MSSPEERFHEMWMGMVQPIEGLVVSMPVLLEAQVGVRHPAALHERFKQHLVLPKARKNADAGAPTLRDLRKLAADLLEIDDGLRDDSPPDDLSIYLTEGRERIAPTWAVRNPSPTGDALTARYQLLTWELPSDVDLDKPDTRDGVWAYPPRAKFERMLRHAGVPIGLLANGRVIRLVYAPQGESSGWVSFRVADMAKVEGRPILDALIMLLHARRFEGAAAGTSLPELLAKSRRVQAEVSKELQGQVRRALETLLRGFEEAAERDGAELLNEAYADGSLYYGLLTVLLRLVFVLFAEDRELLPIEHPLYRAGLSLAGLFERLQEDAARYPDSMSRRFGAYARVIALFRAVYLGVHHGDLTMPARRGDLFSPHTYPFLEGWGSAGGAPITLAEERAKVAIPTVDDSCVFEVLRSLLYLKRERLSYRALDVEQIGSVYEGLIGFVAKKTASPAVRLGDPGTWVEADELLAEKPAARAKWLEERTGLSASKCKEIAQAVAGAKGSKSASDELAAFVDGEDAVGALRFVLQPVLDHNDTQYTPRSLSEPIVETTLRPLLTAMGEAPSSERILSLKVCDPAMGSGAFLVAACRFLGSELISAWTREGVAPALAAAHGGDLVVHARRTVAQKCLYGVDKNPFAVNLGKLSLWLATLAKDESFTFLDHALRCGDSLVGLSLEQIEHFTWEPVAPTTQAKLGQLDLFEDEIANALRDALASRHRIEQLASEGTAEAVRERERLLDDATDALARVRLIGDVIVGAFFAHESDRDRRADLAARERQVRTWLSTRGPIPEALAAMAVQARGSLRPFHWAVEFPEIFFLDRRDPLEDGAVNRAASMDAFIGNPPFSGKNGIIDAGGPAYLPWLQAIHTGAHGNADLVAHFFRRTDSLLGKHGTIGLIATKTIAQGDTRATALKPLVASGLVIYEATRRMPWPGEAKVHVSVVHLAKGNVVGLVPTRRLDKENVIMINSRLRTGEERPDPVPLDENSDKSFVGSYVLGMGFTLTSDERDALVTKSKKNAERIFPYLGGEEVNTSSTQRFDRYVISFGQMDLNEAEAWPDLIAIIREKVKPERDKQNREVRKKYWWRFGEVAPALYAAIKPLKRCLVNSRVSKHLMFAFQPTDRVFSEALLVYPFDDYAHFAVLQSRVHEPWAWLLSSTMKKDLRYSPSDCFENFPFPEELRSVEAPGRAFCEARSAYMKEHGVGLTVTYNCMRDPENHDKEIERLRILTVAMDQAVLNAYGWSDLAPPAYSSPVAKSDVQALTAFEDAVVDRLFALNTKRAAVQKKKTKKK